MTHKYNLCASKHKGITYADDAIICPACGWKETLNDLINDKGFPSDGTDAQKIEWECSVCHKKLLVTMMIAVWRTAVKVIDDSKSMSNPVPKSLDFTGDDV